MLTRGTLIADKKGDLMGISFLLILVKTGIKAV